LILLSYEGKEDAFYGLIYRYVYGSCGGQVEQQTQEFYITLRSSGHLLPDRFSAVKLVKLLFSERLILSYEGRSAWFVGYASSISTTTEGYYILSRPIQRAGRNICYARSTIQAHINGTDIKVAIVTCEN
jgi:hypothetical protein